MEMFVIIALVVLVVGGIGFVSWWFSDDQKAKRAMRETPRRNIAEVMEGERARICGAVELIGEPVQAPLTGRPCAYWRVHVEQKVQTGKNSYWRTLVDEHDGVDFFVTDDSGKALIESVHVQALLHKDGRGSSGFLNDPSPELQEFLHSRGHETEGWFFNKTIRYSEGVAEPGEEVAVVGTGRWERDPDEKASAGSGYREATMPKRLRVSAPEDGTPLLLSDEHDVFGA